MFTMAQSGCYAMNNEKLKLCPFCKKEIQILVCDKEGNIHRESGYEENPWSGLSFALGHWINEENKPEEDCPIATFPDEILGTHLYDTREEAIAAWNRRIGNEF